MLHLVLLLSACRTPPVPPCDSFNGYIDQDGDGFGAELFEGCDPPENLVQIGEDCDDGQPEIHPFALEVCDGVDLDCDGQAEELHWWPDVDQDGFGAGESVYACKQPIAHAAQDGDCDDADPSAWPGAEEIWYDGVDQDCRGGNDWDQDGDLSEYPDDCDDDAVLVFPGAPEICQNGVDEDCNGEVDDCQFFGGVASADYALRVAGLAPSAFGEHQWTGVSAVPVGDIDGDGIGDFGVCSDTENNGSFHIIASEAELSGDLDLQDAVTHLDESCGLSKRRTSLRSSPFGWEGQLFEYGGKFYSPAELNEVEPEPEFMFDGLDGAQKAILDLGNDNSHDLIYRWVHNSRGFEVVEGPFASGLNDVLFDVAWSSHAEIVELVQGDPTGEGSSGLLTIEEQTYPSGPALRFYDPVDLVPGMDASHALWEFSLDPLGLYGDAIPLVDHDVDGDGRVDPVVYGSTDAGGPMRIVGLASSGVGVAETFTVDAGSYHGFTTHQPLDLGDFNNDDHMDIAFSEPGDDGAGTVYLILGPLEGHYTTADAHGWISEGQGIYDTCDEEQTPNCEHYGAWFGYSVRALDHNGDGSDDLLIGAPFYETETPKHGPGAAFVFLGAEGSPW
ncbi:MAG: hypothetical protein ACI9VR_002891 [Cognaticolwellia sp.]|jgi:hypothetical protein